jgi:hypothetical protein
MQFLSFFWLLVFSGLGIISVAQPVWSVNSHAYEFSMTITGKVTIDGQLSTDKEDKIAVFVGTECRGVAKVQLDQGLNGYFIYLMVYSNKMGESLTFYVYDASRNEILEVQNSLSFSVNSMIGSPDDPYLIKATTLSPAACVLKPDFRIYPNPFRNKLYIDIPEGKGDFRIAVYTSNGLIMKSLKQESGSSCILNTAFMTPGIYFVEWQYEQKVEMTRIIKN